MSKGSPYVTLANQKGKDSKKIRIGTRVKIRTYSSRTNIKGRVEYIGDSTFLIDRTKVYYNNVWNIVVTSEKHRMPKWKLGEPIITGTDSSRILRFKKRFDRDSIYQNSSNTISINYNPLNSIFNQHTLEIGYQLNSKHYFGIEGGFIKSNIWWNREHRLYNGTDAAFPFGYYDGWAFALHYKRLNISKSHWFLELSPLYKYLTYDSLYFINSWGDEFRIMEWARTEKTDVYGLKVLMGKRILLSKFLVIQPVFGISMRQYFRSYINHWRTPYPRPAQYDWRTNVLIKENYPVFAIHAGLIIGISNIKL